MKAIKETIRAQGIEIGIYTTDFKRNEFDTFKKEWQLKTIAGLELPFAELPQK